MIELLENLLNTDIPQVEESTIDFPQSSLDMAIWDKIGNSYIMKPGVKKIVLNTLGKYTKINLVDIADEIHITGIQARRSDVSSQTQYLQSKIIELILKGKPPKSISSMRLSTSQTKVLSGWDLISGICAGFAEKLYRTLDPIKKCSIGESSSREPTSVWPNCPPNGAYS